MKKTIAVIGSAAALALSGAGIASAQTNGDETEAPEGPSAIAEQVCGSIEAYDFLGSAAGFAPGLSGDDCAANADAAIDAAFSFEFGAALDIIRGGVDDNGEGDGDGDGDGDGEETETVS